MSSTNGKNLIKNIRLSCQAPKIILWKVHFKCTLSYFHVQIQRNISSWCWCEKAGGQMCHCWEIKENVHNNVLLNGGDIPFAFLMIWQYICFKLQCIRKSTRSRNFIYFILKSGEILRHDFSPATMKVPVLIPWGGLASLHSHLHSFLCENICFLDKKFQLGQILIPWGGSGVIEC